MGIQEFNGLLISHSEGLKHFAISLTRNHENAKDLFQETLFKAFANREKFRHGTNVRAWLHTIMKNIFINDFRRKGRKEMVMDAVLYTSTKKTVEEDLVRLKEIRSAIHKLPSTFKTTIQLYLEGYKNREIAFYLGEPLGTIKSRIHFSKRLLQKQITR
jgi:RNA polymerase sigma-70 factor (ECF subfamily)